MNCKVCLKSFEELSSFHRHLKVHKMTQCEYYQKYETRQDRYDGSIIKYKNYEYYFNTEFNSKSNFNKWLLSVAPETAKTYIVEFLKARKQKKNLVYAPSQVELKTLALPGLKYIGDLFGDYRIFFNELGLKSRFSKNGLDINSFVDVSKKVIFADKREQNPLAFDNITRNKSMSFGDYRMAGSNIFIERKSIADAFGTLTGGYDRFNREIIRAKEANAYLVVLVEGNFNELEQFPMQRQVRGKIKIPVGFAWHSIREIYYNYDMVQFLFVNDREEAARITKKIFSANEQVKDVDLQLLYDLKQL